MYYVYILGNRLRTVFYVGVTNNLTRRLYEHKEKSIPGFTERYQINELLAFEQYGSIYEAISREKEIKGWRREKKFALILKQNPVFSDLSPLVSGDPSPLGSG